MTLTPPVVAPVAVDPINIAFRANQDIQPFSYVSTMSYGEVLQNMRVWLYNTLVPYLNANFQDISDSWEENVTEIDDAVNKALADQATSVDNAIAQALTDFANANLDVTDPVFLALINSTSSQSRQAMDTLYGTRGSMLAPAPTGVASTDTPALQQAMTAAQNAYLDLIITPSALGTVRNYALNAAVSWNLNRGSFIARGDVGLDFSSVSTSYSGAAFTVTTNTTGSGHKSQTHRLQGFTMYGHNTDTSTMDGLIIVEAAPGFGNDMGAVDQVTVLNFRDNLTFGPDTWDFDFRKCSFGFAHRYNINLTGGTGECQQFTECNVYGASNAANTAANLFSPANQTVDARFYGGSFDYPGVRANANGGMQGIIQGGSVSFDKVHFEDANYGPMFTYANTNIGTVIQVTFRDCFWSSTTLGTRGYMHQVLASTRDSIAIIFDGDKGSTSGSTQHWLLDSSGLTSDGMFISYRDFNVINQQGQTLPTALLLGEKTSLLTNGDFDGSSSFVAANGLGWTAGTVGTWTIGSAGGHTGSGLTLVGTGATGTNNTTQRVRISPSRPMLRIAGYQQVTAWTAGSVGLYARFYAEDGVTQIGSDYRLGTDLGAVTGWTGKMRMIRTPKGAEFVSILCSAANFNGTAQWDDIEVVSL